MARITEALTVVNHLSGRVHDWELVEPMTYRLVQPDEGEVVTVPPGFRTDFASIPRPFWSVIAPWGRHGRAAVIHDFLYQLGAVTDPTRATLRRPSKREADRIFREAMVVLDHAVLRRSERRRRISAPLLRLRFAAAATRRWLLWGAVALFGHWAYAREQRRGTAPALEHAMLEDVATMLRAGGHQG
jgi:hypothetical protein